MSRAVQRVGSKIVEQSENPFMKWQFHVIDSPEPNAFCLPGQRSPATGGRVYHIGMI